MLNFIKGEFSISANISEHDGYNWWFTAIYGPASRIRRSKFWEELNGIVDLCGPNWIIGEDFNVFRWNTETSSPNSAKYNMNKFNSFILRSQLIDPPLINGFYTWSNLREKPVLSRLDKFLYSPNWEQRFSSHQCRILTRITSDHFLVILEAPSVPWGPSPFRFNNLWIKEDNFNTIIEIW